MVFGVLPGVWFDLVQVVLIVLVLTGIGLCMVVLVCWFDV